LVVAVAPPNIVQQTDEALNDSDKTFTVPVGQVWALSFLIVNFVTTATPGNRQMRVELGDGTRVIWFKDFGAVQAASLTRNYYASAEMPNDAAFDAAGRIRIELEEHVLPAGYTVRVFDSAAIDAAADDMKVYLIVNARRKPAPSPAV